MKNSKGIWTLLLLLAPVFTFAQDDLFDLIEEEETKNGETKKER